MSSEDFWAAGRGFGVVALVMLTLSVVLGVVARSGRPVLGMERFAWQRIHRDAALTATGLVTIHVTSLLFDSYARLRLIDLVMPMIGAYKPFWQGLGTLAVDILIAVVLTALTRGWIGQRAFHVVHWATYALWPISVLHGLGNGTDAGEGWFIGLTIACCVAVVAVFAWRVGGRFEETASRRRQAMPAGDPRRLVRERSRG